MPVYIVPEAKQRIGVWGAPTSTLDWCEENHIVTSFIAELWNTLSNAWFVFFGFVGLWYCFKYRLERRYILSFGGLIVVGIGSTLFHATLKLSMQLLDELPMLFLSAVFLFSLFEMGQVRGRYTTRTYISVAIITTYTTLVSLVYVVVNDPTFHQVAYALMVLAITYMGFRNLGVYAKWKYLTFSIVSLLVYLMAFVLWNIDNHFCPGLREFRTTSPVVGVVTQFHSWWHFLAATGTYFHLLLSSRIRMEQLGHQCVIKAMAGVPYLEVQHRRE